MGWTIGGWLRGKIGDLGWMLFLWGNETTAEDYWSYVYEQERANKRKAAPGGTK